MQMLAEQIGLLMMQVSVYFNRELDKAASNVPNASLPLSLGNLGLLIADPTIDKMALHSQIMHTYKWSVRVSRVLIIIIIIPGRYL